MSFREKHLWISLVAGLGVWGVYFWHLGQQVAAGRLEGEGLAVHMGWVFVLCLVAVVLLEGVLTFLASATTRKIDKTDREEREIQAALKASHVALMVLIGLVMSLALLVCLGGLIGGDLVEARRGVTDVNAMVLLANALVACLVVAEAVRAGVTLGLLRALR